MGTGAYENAVNAIMAFIGEQMIEIQTWEDNIRTLPATAEGETEPTGAAKKRAEY